VQLAEDVWKQYNILTCLELTGAMEPQTAREKDLLRTVQEEEMAQLASFSTHIKGEY
jgi:hypothetical protein